MSEKHSMLDHHLFKDRRRVLAVPAHAEKPVTRTGKMVLTNLMVASLIFGVFLAGTTLANTTYRDAISGLLGRHWKDILSAQMGTSLGEGFAEKSPWIMARAGGVIAYLTLYASVAVGLLSSSRLLPRFIHSAAVIYFHRLLSLITLVFLIMHVVGLMLDNYLKFSLVDCIVPFTGPYRPLFTGIGTLSFYGIMAVVISVYMSDKIGYKAWKMLHYLSFAVFAASLAHGLLTGTDSKADWAINMYIVTGVSVFILLEVRIFKSWFQSLKKRAVN
ncbi:MAG: ferric reductase-like transmembrane domain-containing protein [Chloroflexi bacterium]|uniref:Ferric reductase-like transmembrane domain-containing protein n=1 Tax=Candidatus Chlorohelix allophototropha TaxID=3003348 RepID=A0A8T7LUK8_9CHLR|nr:ferric reductase-like transmembrane domain-containing protein [Chloroflexota bacterium]WJW66464.1 ferric reductase-like transmembrane domain-containing protein [Chloroflexota bacterium L227-S17]